MEELKHITQTPVAVVGSVNLDIKTSRLKPTPKLFDDGETSVEEIYESIGGGGANTATAAAHLGGKVHFCGCVGDDPLGTRLEQTLTKYGVQPHLVRKNTATGRSLNLNWQNHQRHFISSLPNNRLMRVEDIDVAALAAAGCYHLYRADVWFAEPMLNGGNLKLLRAARAAKMQTSLDINWDPEWSLPDNEDWIVRRKAQLATALSQVDWVHGNNWELLFFTGTEDIRKAAWWLLDHGCGCVIVHRGQQGAAAFNAKDGWLEVPAAPVEKIVCETGTGDVFSAAFLLIKDLPLKERLVACAAIAAGHLAGKGNFIPRL